MTPFAQKMLDACAKDNCPSWWMCAKRGCYKDALANQTDYKGKREAWGEYGQDWYRASDGSLQEKGSGYHGHALRWRR